MPPVATPQVDDLFDPAAIPNRKDRLELYKAFKDALRENIYSSAVAYAKGETMFIPGSASTEERPAAGIVKRQTGVSIDALRESYVTKGLAADSAEMGELNKAFAAIASIDKDLTLTSPISGVPFPSSGIVPFDVMGPLAMLIPRNFTFRNMVARTKGIGQSAMFQQITGISNSGTGGVANLSPFFATGVTDSFGGVTLNRPKKISYAGSRVNLPYGQLGFSTEIDYTAQFAGKDYVDLRETGHQALIWSHWLGEERAMGNGRNYVLAAPTGTFTPAVDNHSTATGLPAGAGTVIVTALSSFGESQGIAGSAGVTTVAGQSIKLSAVGALAADSLGLVYYYTNTGSGIIYRGQTPDISGATGPAKFVVVGANPSTVADNGSYDTSGNGYNGFVTTLNNATLPNSVIGGGYQLALNGLLSTSEPGGEVQDLFAALWESVQARPDKMLTTGKIRRYEAKALQNGSNGFRINLNSGDTADIGTAVNAIENESAGGAGDSGGMVALVAWPYMPEGVILIHSTMFPFPDAGFSNTVEARNVVDLTLIEWPQIGLTWDSSSYQYGTLPFRSPGWSGAITNCRVY